MPDAATLTTLVQLFGPIGALAIVVGYGIWQKSPSKPPVEIVKQSPVSQEYEKTMGSMMGRIADTLEAQTVILDKIERQLLVLLSQSK